MTIKSITPFLWFDTQAEDAAKFYVSLFPNSRITHISRYGDAGPGPKGTVMVVVNSICGCAAGRMRPGVRAAIQSGLRPDRMITVFAGQDREATDAARQHFTGFPPSSPSIGLLRDGKLVYMMQRHDIETSDPMTIATRLKQAFEKHCAKEAVSN